MSLASPRALFLSGFIFCLAIIGGALYLEHVLGQQPCPLCIVQRACVMVFGLVCLLAAVHAPGRGGQRAYALLAMLSAAAGAGTAGRQVWLQNVPADELPACLPSLDYMMQALPFQDIGGLCGNQLDAVWHEHSRVELNGVFADDCIYPVSAFTSQLIKRLYEIFSGSGLMPSRAGHSLARNAARELLNLSGAFPCSSA
jgi:disulfide bond formation protein DsbB